MVLRGQGDSPVRICDPCKKLEEAARYELRYGHKNRAQKGLFSFAGPFYSYTWYSEIYHNTILYIWKIVINQKQWTPCWLIVLLSPWNPFKMQFTCKFDYHHNIKHILNISALAQALSCKSILFEKLILLYGKYIHTVRSTEAYGH